MRVTLDEYREYVKQHKTVSIENVKIPIGAPHAVKAHNPADDYKLETTTVYCEGICQTETECRTYAVVAES